MEETAILIRDHPPDATIVLADPETNMEFGTLGIIWKPRFFGRWGRYMPRVSFTGDVEKSAKELLKFMVVFLRSEVETNTYEVKWMRPGDPDVLRCVDDIGLLVHRMQAAIRLNGEITVCELKRLS